MAKPIIEVSNLSKVYRLGEIGATSLREETARAFRKMRGLEPPKDLKDFWALRDVSFSVERGDVVGVIGRNGAGKSTLLKVISRITEPTKGRIRLGGRVAALLEVGTGMHPELTGRENIYLNGTILGMRKREIDRKLDEIIDFAGISKHLDTPVKRYSSGMNVRLGFAVAAHLEPEILIIDEVLAVGDAEFQKKCMGKVKDVASHGRTVLFVSHNLGLVRSFCSKGLLLHSGVRQFFGSCSAAIDRYVKITQDAKPENKAVATSKTVALLDAEVRSIDGSTVIQSGTPFEIEFSVKDESENPSSTNVYFELFNASGVLVSAFRSGSRGIHDTTRNEPGIFRCKIEDNGLRPGDYYIDVKVRNQEKDIDVVESALSISVSDGYIQERLVNPQNQGGVYQIPHTWSKPNC